MDIRPETKPDLIGDIRKTNFPDAMFDIIYVDPPHMIRKDGDVLRSQFITTKRRLSGRRSLEALKRYSFFKSNEEWYDFIEKTNNEIFRILKPTGKLCYKIVSGPDKRIVQREHLVRMTNFIITDEKITKSKGPGGKNKTHWLTMVPMTKERGSK